MPDSIEMAEVLDLLGRAPRPPSEPAPVGATGQELAELERALGIPLPDELRDWLSVCRGSLAGPGGLYGVGSGANSIVAVLGHYPDWRSRRWIPIAGDGCGNQYVIDATRQFLDADAIYFVDMMDADDAFGYVAASSVTRFLRFVLEKELGTRGWPFDPAFVLAHDPAVGAVREPKLLPWNA